jgi:hypothetical protein
LPGCCADLLKKSLAEIDLVYEINGWSQQLAPPIATAPIIAPEKLETSPCATFPITLVKAPRRRPPRF